MFSVFAFIFCKVLVVLYKVVVFNANTPAGLREKIKTLYKTMLFIFKHTDIMKLLSLKYINLAIKLLLNYILGVTDESK